MSIVSLLCDYTLRPAIKTVVYVRGTHVKDRFDSMIMSMCRKNRCKNRVNQ